MRLENEIPHNKYSSTSLQGMLINWLEPENFNVMATLTFKATGGIKLKAAEKTFGRFAARLIVKMADTHPKHKILWAPIVENSREQLGMV